MPFLPSTAPSGPSLSLLKMNGPLGRLQSQCSATSNKAPTLNIIEIQLLIQPVCFTLSPFLQYHSHNLHLPLKDLSVHSFIYL